jgi:uroporphyrinogen decarboxylase
MVEAVKKVAPHFEGIVEWREHPIKKLEAVSFMSSLMVKNIPTICIDGKIAFVSKIPPKKDLVQAIQERINEKLKLKIRSKRGEIFILGKNQEECQGLVGVLDLAMTELGKEMDYKIVTDENQRITFGVLETPAVIVADYKLKSQGTIPSLEVVKEWLKEI